MCRSCSGLIWVFVPACAVVSVWWAAVVAGPVHLLRPPRINMSDQRVNFIFICMCPVAVYFQFMDGHSPR